METVRPLQADEQSALNVEGPVEMKLGSTAGNEAQTSRRENGMC
jgi:hypothetical protein